MNRYAWSYPVAAAYGAAVGGVLALALVLLLPVPHPERAIMLPVPFALLSLVIEWAGRRAKKEHVYDGPPEGGQP